MRQETKHIFPTGVSWIKYILILTGIHLFLIQTGCERPPDLFGTAGSENIKDTQKDPQQDALELKEEPIGLFHSGATIVRIPIESKEEGIWGVEIYLDDEKINIVNQRRDTSKISTYSELFGVDRDFKPLFVINSNKRGMLKIRSTRLGEILVETKEGPEKIEIYPEFIKDELFKDTTTNLEKIDILFEDPEGKVSLVERVQIPSSSQRELFTEDLNLSDIASLTKEEGVPTSANKDLGLNDTLLGAMRGLKRYQIKYEYLEDRVGYKRIRSIEEMKGTGLANDIEINIWIATLLKSQGFSPLMMITKDRVILGIKDEENISNPSLIYLDPKVFIEENKNLNKEGLKEEEYKWRLDKSLISGNHLIKEAFTSDPDKMFALDLKEWENLFIKSKNEKLD
jgi:hypothetical protein